MLYTHSHEELCTAGTTFGILCPLVGDLKNSIPLQGLVARWGENIPSVFGIEAKCKSFESLVDLVLTGGYHGMLAEILIQLPDGDYSANLVYVRTYSELLSFAVDKSRIEGGNENE